MKKGTQVIVTMTRGPERTGKFLREVSNHGTWYVIQPPEKGAMEFKARPSKVRPA